MSSAVYIFDYIIQSTVEIPSVQIGSKRYIGGKLYRRTLGPPIKCHKMPSVAHGQLLSGTQFLCLRISLACLLSTKDAEQLHSKLVCDVDQRVLSYICQEIEYRSRK